MKKRPVCHVCKKPIKTSSYKVIPAPMHLRCHKLWIKAAIICDDQLRAELINVMKERGLAT